MDILRKVRLGFCGIVLLAFTAILADPPVIEAQCGVQVESPDPDQPPPSPNPNPSFLGETVTISLNAKATLISSGTSPCSQMSPTWSWSKDDPSPITADNPAVVLYSAHGSGDPATWPVANTSTYTLSLVQPSTSGSGATLTVTFSTAGHYRISPIVTASFGTGSCCEGQARPVFLCHAKADPPTIAIEQLEWTTGMGFYWKDKVNNIHRPSPGNQIKFKATITPATEKRKIRFILVGTSKMPGINMNEGDQTGFDLYFDNQAGFVNPTDPKQEIVEDNANDNTATVIVTADDYGPFGKIKAKIENTNIESNQINVLHDADNNDIEDAWDDANPAPAAGNKGKNDDNDDTPNIGTVNGDLLIRYEEYRGFKVKDPADLTKNKYVTTDPAKKTVFLKDDTGYTVTDGGGAPLSLFPGLLCEVYFVGTGQYNANREINFNGGVNKQRAIFVQNSNLVGSAWGATRGPATGITPSNYTSCRVNIDKFTSKPNTVNALTAAQVDAVVYSGASDFVSRVRATWQANGRIKIENEIIAYATGFEAGTRLSDVLTKRVAVPAASTSIMVDGIHPFNYVKIEDEIIRVQSTYLGGNGKIKAVAVGDVKVGLSSFTGLRDPGGAYIVYAKIEDEWISYTGVDGATNDLTGVTRGVLGSTAAAHAAGKSILFPAQMLNCLRGQLGTAAAVHAVNKNVVPLGVLLTLTRGVAPTAAAAHAANTSFFVFSNVNDPIRQTCAHEAGHAVSLDHDVNAQIMQEFLSPGAFLTNGVYNAWNAQDKVGFDAK